MGLGAVCGSQWGCQCMLSIGMGVNRGVNMGRRIKTELLQRMQGAWE